MFQTGPAKPLGNCLSDNHLIHFCFSDLSISARLDIYVNLHQEPPGGYYWQPSRSGYSIDTSQKSAGPPLLRMGHPMAFTAFLRHVGAPVERYLRSQKLPVLCNDPNMFVPLARAWSFFSTTAQHEDPMLGWLVGAHAGDHNLNLGLLRKLEIAPTLFQAMQRLVQMARSEASHIQLGIHERRTDVLFYTHYSGMREVPGYRTAQAYQIGVMLGLIRHFLGQHWAPG